MDIRLSLGSGFIWLAGLGAHAATLGQTYYGATTDRVLQLDFNCSEVRPAFRADVLRDCTAEVKLNPRGTLPRPHEVVRTHDTSGRGTLHLDLATGDRLSLLIERDGSSRVRLQTPELLSPLYTRIATAPTATEIWALGSRLDVMCETAGELFTIKR